MGGLFSCLGGCGLFADYRYRCRMTVDIETPGGVKRGSSVFEVRTLPGTDLMTGANTSDSFVRGEAVVVDLPDDEILCALLKTRSPASHDNLAHMSMLALDPAFDFHPVATAKRLRSRSKVRSSGVVPTTAIPILVTFADPTEPMSVKEVDPNNLAATFGNGVRLAAIRVELTDDPVTEGLRQRLPWLQADSAVNLDSDFKPTIHPTLPQQLRHADFSRRTLE